MDCEFSLRARASFVRSFSSRLTFRCNRSFNRNSTTTSRITLLKVRLVSDAFPSLDVRFTDLAFLLPFQPGLESTSLISNELTSTNALEPQERSLDSTRRSSSPSSSRPRRDFFSSIWRVFVSPSKPIFLPLRPRSFDEPLPSDVLTRLPSLLSLDRQPRRMAQGRLQRPSTHHRASQGYHHR